LKGDKMEKEEITKGILNKTIKKDKKR